MEMLVETAVCCIMKNNQQKKNAPQQFMSQTRQEHAA
jgi:hypothetical protein